MKKEGKNNNLNIFMGLISIIGCSILLLNPPDLSNLNLENFMFLLLCIIASNTSITFKSGINMTLTAPVAIFLLLIQDMSTAVYIGSLGLLSYQVIAGRKLNRILFNVTQFTISIYLAGLFLYQFHTGEVRLPHDLIPIALSITIVEIVNLALVSIAIGFKTQGNAFQIFIDGFKETQVGMPLYLTNGLIMYICYKSHGMWGLILVIVPLFSVYWLLQATKTADMHKEHATLCPTTDLKNKRCLNEWMQNQFCQVVQTNQDISFILIDIDDFKKINDNYGHDKGDEVLKEFGTLLKENTRYTDLIYRYGGEEFVIILPDFNEDRAHSVIERIRDIVDAHPFTEHNLKITFSAGIAGLDSRLLHDENLSTADEMIRRADMAMYSAKQSGKNQTKFYAN